MVKYRKVSKYYETDCRHRHETWTYKILHVLVRSCLCVINNTEATIEAQFIIKLSNTEAELKQCVTYKKGM